MLEASPGDMVVVSKRRYRKLCAWSVVGVMALGALGDAVWAQMSGSLYRAPLVDVVQESRIDNASNIFLIGTYLCKANGGLSIVVRRGRSGQRERYDFTCRNGAQFLNQQVDIKTVESGELGSIANTKKE